MAKVVVQNINGQDSALTTTVVATLAASGAGNLLVVVLIEDGSSGENWLSVSDNIQGTTGWVQAVGAQANGSGSCVVDIWYKLSCPAGVTTIIATRDTSSANPKIMFVREVSGWSTCAADGAGVTTVSGTGSGTDYSAPSKTTTTTDGFVVAGLVSPGTAMTVAPKAGNEFTSDPTPANSIANSVASVSLVSTTAAGHQAVFTGNDPTQSFNSVAFAFKETGAGGAPLSALLGEPVVGGSTF